MYDLKRADKAGLTWPKAKELSDAEIESCLFRHVGRKEPSARAPIDYPWVTLRISVRQTPRTSRSRSMA